MRVLCKSEGKREWLAGDFHSGGGVGSGGLSLVGAAESIAAGLDAVDSQALPYERGDRAAIFAEAPGLRREFALWMMLRALPSATLGIERTDLFGAADGADHPVRPTADCEVINAVVKIREVGELSIICKKRESSPVSKVQSLP